MIAFRRILATDGFLARFDAGPSARRGPGEGVPRPAPDPPRHDAAVLAGADLIVMGTHGRGSLDRTLLGSVADLVIRLAPCPVVIVRETE